MEETPHCMTCRRTHAMGGVEYKVSLLKSPHTIVLPGQRGVVEMAKHGKDINSFSSPETMQKGAFELEITHT